MKKYISFWAPRVLGAFLVLLLSQTSCNLLPDSREEWIFPEYEEIGTLSTNPKDFIVNDGSNVLAFFVVDGGIEFSEASVSLYRVDEKEETFEKLGELFDNGNLGNSDEIQGDNVFTGNFFFNEDVEGEVFVQIVTELQVGALRKEARSDIVRLMVYKDISQAEFEIMRQIKLDAIDVFFEKADKDFDKVESALDETVNWLIEQEEVISARRFGSTAIEVKYSFGTVGAIFISYADENGRVTTKQGIPERRNSSATIPVHEQTVGINDFSPEEASFKTDMIDPDLIGNRKVIIYSPFETAFGHEIVPALSMIFDDSKFQFDVDIYEDGAANIAALTNLTNYGMVLMDTHGAGGEWMLTGERVTDANKITYKPLLMANKLGLFTNIVVDEFWFWDIKDDVYGVSDRYVRDLSGNFPNSVIINSSCEGTQTSKLENAFFAKGAKSYFGYSENVTVGFAKQQTIKTVETLVKDQKTTGDVTVNIADPNTPAKPAIYQLKGSSLMHYPVSLINGDFEYGDLSGWTKQGDGRNLTKLGFAVPEGPNHMGIISTGLGFTTATGSIAQSFEVSNSASKLKVSWNYISEEFLEFINSQFQDVFEIVLIDESGVEHVLLRKTIDQIAIDFGATRNTQGNLLTGSPSIVFDQGGTYLTDWINSSFDISPYRGQVVTLRLATGDVGDSIYDTAVLLDNISIE
ncbi:MAG: choice-of-anchor L domain-containing protein [Bacteroidota bacterium]